jgi:ribose 5-phosphate isomerase A
VTPDELKKAAALAALDHVEGGMRLGLGTGSTAAHFIAGLGERVRKGLDVVCVPTSEATRQQAEDLGIALTTLDETPDLDLTVDGADEVDGNLDLIKGGGGALLREKIVAFSSRRMIVIADSSKQVGVLGKYPLPVEVVPFGWRATEQKLDQAARRAGAEGPVTLRVKDAKPFVTDSGNFILDCAFGSIPDPGKLAAALSAIPGVIEHGLFIGMADLAIIAGPAGIATLTRP